MPFKVHRNAYLWLSQLTYKYKPESSHLGGLSPRQAPPTTWEDVPMSQTWVVNGSCVLGPPSELAALPATSATPVPNPVAFLGSQLLATNAWSQSRGSSPRRRLVTPAPDYFTGYQTLSAEKGRIRRSRSRLPLRTAEEEKKRGRSPCAGHGTESPRTVEGVRRGSPVPSSRRRIQGRGRYFVFFIIELTTRARPHRRTEPRRASLNSARSFG